VPPASDVTLPIEGAVRGVAGNGSLLFASIANDSVTTTVQAYRGGASAWHAELAGSPGVLAATDHLVAAALSLSSASPGGPVASASRVAPGTQVAAAGGAATPGAPMARSDVAPAVRGDPAAAVVALDASTGAKQWTVVFDSTEWSVISSVAPLGDGFVVGGLFGGTLRAGSHVVSSAGGSDGFVARVSATGDVAWVFRMGGGGADGVQGVATRGERIAIAGSFNANAELGGIALPPYDEHMPFADGFVAELDATGNRKWAQSFGGRGEDTVAGVAIDARGNVVVAASANEVVHVGSQQLVTSGASDGIIAWFGESGAATAVGGLDFDGLRAITTVGDQAIVGGFFSGSMLLGGQRLTAGGGDDAFLAAYDPNGAVAHVWHVTGDGREEITALASISGGVVAGIAHTANLTVDDAKLPAPKDPMAGSALIVRGIR
jgi:hypothetical protein